MDDLGAEFGAAAPTSALAESLKPLAGALELVCRRALSLGTTTRCRCCLSRATMAKSCRLSPDPPRRLVEALSAWISCCRGRGTRRRRRVRSFVGSADRCAVCRARFVGVLLV